MTLQKANPAEHIEQAAESLYVIGDLLKQTAEDNESQLFALAHLTRIANALSVMESMLCLISYINRPALDEAQASYLQHMREKAGHVH